MTFYWVRTVQPPAETKSERSVQHSAEPEGRVKPKHLPVGGALGEKPATWEHQLWQMGIKGKDRASHQEIGVWLEQNPGVPGHIWRAPYLGFVGHSDTSWGRVWTCLKDLSVHLVIRRGLLRACQAPWNSSSTSKVTGFCLTSQKQFYHRGLLLSAQGQCSFRATCPAFTLATWANAHDLMDSFVF